MNALNNIQYVYVRAYIIARMCAYVYENGFRCQQIND